MQRVAWVASRDEINDPDVEQPQQFIKIFCASGDNFLTQKTLSLSTFTKLPIVLLA